MDRDFWLARWRDKRIGWHEGAPNSLLVAHFGTLGVAAGGRIFVPLCGKSQDMLWLAAQGFGVVGAELSRMAVEQFFAELGLTPTVTPGRLERFEAGGVTIFLGDIFNLDRETLGEVDAVYDRAALVAMPDALRARYAKHIVALTNTAPQLVVTFEYDQAQVPGPPFSVPEAEVLARYGGFYRAERAEIRDVPSGMGGVTTAEESVWLLRPLGV